MPRQTKQYSYNRVQYANPDPYDLHESDIDGNILQLNVLANDTLPRKGGLTLHSVDDGLGNTTNDLLTPDSWLSSMSAPDYLWGTTERGNLVAIYNNTVVYKPTAAFMGVANIDDLTMNDVLTDSFTYAVRLSDNTLSWSTVTITLRGEGPDAVDDSGGTIQEDSGMNFQVLANDAYLGQATLVTLGTPTLLVNGSSGFISPDSLSNAFSIDPNTGAIAFNPGNALDPLSAGDTAQISVSYVMSDTSGQTSTATLRFEVAGANEYITGGSGDDWLSAIYSSELHGLGGNDMLEDLVQLPSGTVQFYGGPGSDTLVGGVGFDEIHMDAPWGDGAIDALRNMDFSRDVIVLDSYKFAGLQVDFNHHLLAGSYLDVATYTPGQVGVFYGPDIWTGGTALYYAGAPTGGVLTEFASVDISGSQQLDVGDFYVV